MKKTSPIERNSLSNQAESVLKTRILAGQIPPGTHLIVDVLANELQISRTPVREALSKLVSKGLVSYDGNSYIVASYTAKDVKELFAIRRTLEMLAIREACARLTEEEFSHFRVLCERAAKRIREMGEDMNLMIELDTKFHNLIYDGSQNQRLKNILIDIQEKIWFIHRWGYLTKKVEYAETAPVDEYLEFLRYLESRDAEKAARLLEKHLVFGEEFTLECLGFSAKTDSQSRPSPDKN